MAHMTAAARSVSQIVGRSEAPVNGDNDRPYGKCYGQVCGQYYPELQREYVDPKKDYLEERKAESKDAKKAEYQRVKRSRKTPHNGSKRVRCIDTGAVYPSICAAANAIGMKHSTLSYKLNEHGRAVCNGRSYEFEEVR